MDPSNSSARAAAKTATQFKKTRAVAMGYPKNSPTVKNDVALLRGEGFSHAKTARALGLSTTTVQHIAAQPDVKARIEAMREQWRVVAQEKMGQVANEAWTMTEEFAKQRDAKGFDSATRGLHALEKISASTHGQAQRVEVSGIPGSDNPRIEIKNLLVALFGDKRE